MYKVFVRDSEALVFLSGSQQQDQHTGSPVCVYTTLPSLYQPKTSPFRLCGGILESMLMFRAWRLKVMEDN